MKFWKTVIRIWFTLASLASFLVGWVVIAHSPKPNQFKASDIPPMPKLEPVPSLDQVVLSNQSDNFIRPSQQHTVILRSGGS
ncbi:MAG TPA: hypothetical protein VK249_08225 [Anaerolineales bacterium]|nr:hypothetical protein [Anaerolineales bacterium]